jgi:hypothetical protein
VVECLGPDGQVVERKTKKLLRRGDWNAAAWRLSRRFPKKWGPQSRESIPASEIERKIERSWRD